MSQRLLTRRLPARPPGTPGTPGSVFSTISVASVVSVTVFVALTAIPLYAQEEGGGLSPFAGNLGNAIWTLLIFLLVVVVLGKFAWGPVLATLRQREEFIHKSLSDAKRDREEAEKRLKEYTANLQSAQAQAMEIIEGARRDSERLREEMKQKAK